jgi:hypothetical protein
MQGNEIWLELDEVFSQFSDRTKVLERMDVPSHGLGTPEMQSGCGISSWDFFCRGASNENFHLVPVLFEAIRHVENVQRRATEGVSAGNREENSEWARECGRRIFHGLCREVGSGIHEFAGAG